MIAITEFHSEEATESRSIDTENRPTKNLCHFAGFPIVPFLTTA
jgi:hypothetical protein